MKVADTKENLGKCMCGSCPTFNACMKEKMQGLFCALGKSSCGPASKGCLCGRCPLWLPNKLSGGAFCIAGAAN